MKYSCYIGCEMLDWMHMVPTTHGDTNDRKNISHAGFSFAAPELWLVNINKTPL